MRSAALLLSLLMAPMIYAQEVQVQKQRSLKKWGVPAGNYSGITHIQDDRYALISDKQEADGWTEVSIRFLPSGEIEEVQFIAQHYNTQTLGKARDSEGIVYVPGKGFYVSAENDQQILELAEDGTATGHDLSVPDCFSTANIFPNYGFEALAYDTRQGIFWTTTEQGLRTDVTAPSTPENPQPTLLRLQSFSADGKPLCQYAYRTDAPITRRTPRHYAFGVPELLAVDDTTLLVMERELNVPQNYNGAKCHIRIYSVNPRLGEPITDLAQPLQDMDEKKFLPKKLLYAFSTGIRFLGRKNLANYEGMCLGPCLADGRQTILLVADSQNRAGNPLFHLKDYIRVIVGK